MPPLSLDAARAAVIAELSALAAGRPAATEQLPLEAALGRVLAEEIRADRDQPPFPRVTRDGFAVRAADVAAATPARPVALAVAGEVAAGAVFEGAVGAGSCVEIMTGAPLPNGADAVVMVEQTTRSGADRVLIAQAVVAGEHVVPRGSELREAAVACAVGTRLDPARIGLLASLGATRPRVCARPRVALLATGDEIVPADAQPQLAQIRNSNEHALAAQVTRAGGVPLSRGIAKDDPAALKDAIAGAIEVSDLLLVSGGVSMGKYDFVEEVLASLGARIVFDSVAIRPGKPLVFGVVAGKPFFGLPGNPLSTLVTFELFVRPALAALSGASDVLPPLLGARLVEPYVQRALPLTAFVPAAFAEGSYPDAPHAAIRALTSQGSGDLAAMARADLLLVVPAGTETLSAGAAVCVLPL